MKKIIAISLLLLLVFTLSACGAEEEETSMQLIIAGKDTTEQLIVDQMLLLLIEEKTDHTAVVSTNSYLTSYDLAEGAEKGDVHIYVDYDGSMYENALELEWADAENTDVTNLVRNTFNDELALTVKDAIGFSGGYTVYITDEKLESLGTPDNLSALVEQAPDLVIGMEQSFYDRADAYDAFALSYGFAFHATQIYPEKDGFAALMAGDIDLLVGETTSPYYSLYDLNAISDDKGFFLPAIALPVVSSEVLTDYPEIGDAITLTKKLITTKTMSSLVAKVELEGMEIADVARDFLRARSLI